MAVAKRALQQTVKASAAAMDVVRRPAPGIVVLIYHRVGAASGLEVDLPTAQFEEQMAALAATGKVVRLEDALGLLATPNRHDAKETRVVVTFDDGTADFADNALPV